MPHTQQLFFEKTVLVPSITDHHCFPFVTVWKRLRPHLVFQFFAFQFFFYFCLSIKMIISICAQKVQCYDTRENKVLFFVAINFSWLIDATAHRVDSRRMILFPASCARCLKVFRADLKQPPETNGHEEGTGQSQALPVKTKRKKQCRLTSIWRGRLFPEEGGERSMACEKPSEGVALQSWFKIYQQ